LFIERIVRFFSARFGLFVPHAICFAKILDYACEFHQQVSYSQYWLRLRVLDRRAARLNPGTKFSPSQVYAGQSLESPWAVRYGDLFSFSMNHRLEISAALLIGFGTGLFVLIAPAFLTRTLTPS